MNTPDTPTPREQRRARAQQIVGDLNNSSDECLMALDDLRILDLEDRIAQLERELTAAKDELANAKEYGLQGDTVIAELRRDRETLRDSMDALRTETQEQARLLGMSGEREADLRGEIERLRRRVEAADGLAEAAEDALHHTINTPTYPDGPCMNKEYRDDLRTALQAYRATEGKK